MMEPSQERQGFQENAKGAKSFDSRDSPPLSGRCCSSARTINNAPAVPSGWPDDPSSRPSARKLSADNGPTLNVGKNQIPEDPVTPLSGSIPAEVIVSLIWVTAVALALGFGSEIVPAHQGFHSDRPDLDVGIQEPFFVPESHLQNPQRRARLMVTNMEASLISLGMRICDLRPR